MCVVFSRRAISLAAMALMGVLGATLPAVAQTPRVHYLPGPNPPPGLVGQAQLQRGGPIAGYFQPVEIRAPQGAMVSLVVGDDFSEPAMAPATVGLLIAPIYRLRITNI